MDMLHVLWLGAPAWTWLVFISIVVVLLAFTLLRNLPGSWLAP